MRLFLAAVLVIGSVGDRPPATETENSLRPLATIALPNVAGRIDHLGFDTAQQRLFVAALGNDTVEVIDTAKNAVLRSLPGFHEPQGVAVVPELGGVVIANGGTGTLQMVDASTLQTRWTISIGGDADNVRYDAAAKRIFVAFQGGIASVDPVSGRALQRIAINGHPESFQLESRGPRLFANLPGGSTLIVADRQAATVSARWSTAACGANYPMALDEASHRLFVGCRRPSSLALFDATTGKLVVTVPAVGDTDDLFYDTMRQRIYVLGGEGFVDVVQRTGDVLRRTTRVPTSDGARTGMWVAAQDRLYVAVPARRGRPAEIRIFSAF